MSKDNNKKTTSNTKSELHPRNIHRERYDFDKLLKSSPDLEDFVFVNQYGKETIDFFDSEAVKTLNKALLKEYYGIEHWDIFPNYLCPPVPGRADYIHYIADLLGSLNGGKIPRGKKIKCLDIGVGANCIYPIVGNKVYGWTFVGTDVDYTAIKSANNIVRANPSLKGKIDCRWQENPNDIFYGILDRHERFEITICNPPFHASAEEAAAGTLRKWKNLTKDKSKKDREYLKPVLNFGGQKSELWCEGGERRFVKSMIFQSKHFSKSCFWFSTLVSKESNLKNYYKYLQKVRASKVQTIEMGQGNKKSRILAWTFLTKQQQDKWIEMRWEQR